VGVLRCGVEVDDPGVERVAWIYRESRDPDEFLERAGSAEGHAPGERLGALDIEADDPRLARRT